ncbi:spermidine/putrescine ABC transporter substrate-binding protein [Cryobacterium sp. PH29-G1]|uniref:spermidine/putrescine ABC transporter substrate-binding protein n=1 Tax=Cryobacterium sp. PH29-G1 TaxID=3046211 RepID=UPI0024BBC72E|nr:spermidine/putrescine ABC transporter substrate-binding protein [Cryobacterium sp. PH29-G1]MDJ0347765.1 spermidine/putrescine ABC transporter substrate-binding protein [Cryobacterium sp. PH29-G1]
MDRSIESRVNHEVENWLRWITRWRPATHRGRARLCRQCFGSPIIAAAGLAVDVPHVVQHALSMRMKIVIDASVDEYTERNLPLLAHELNLSERRESAQAYRPAEGLDPEFLGLDLDPQPAADAPYLFTFAELTDQSPAELSPLQDAGPESGAENGVASAAERASEQTTRDGARDGARDGVLDGVPDTAPEVAADTTPDTAADATPDSAQNTQHAGPPHALPPLSSAEKAALTAELHLADEFATQVGLRVCAQLAQQRPRLLAAIAEFVEPQVQALLADLESSLDSPIWPHNP